MNKCDERGAAGYLDKDVDPEALVRGAIRTAADGNLVLAPEAAGPLTARS